MSDTKKNPRGHVMLGLLLGLGLAVLVALVAFGLMSKKNSPVQANPDLENANTNLNEGVEGPIDPNQSLQSKLPYQGGKNTITTAKNDENNKKSIEDNAAEPKNNKVEIIDEDGDRQLVTRDELKKQTELLEKKAQQDRDDKIIEKVIANEESFEQEDTLADTQKSYDPIKRIAKADSGETRLEKSANSTYFFVQTGAFKNQEQADQQKAVLIMQGLNARIQTTSVNGETLYRVRLGPFQEEAQVSKIERRLQNEDIPHKVIKVSE